MGGFWWLVILYTAIRLLLNQICQEALQDASTMVGNLLHTRRGDNELCNKIQLQLSLD